MNTPSSQIGLPVLFGLFFLPYMFATFVAAHPNDGAVWIPSIVDHDLMFLAFAPRAVDVAFSRCSAETQYE